MAFADFFIIITVYSCLVLFHSFFIEKKLTVGIIITVR